MILISVCLFIAFLIIFEMMIMGVKKQLNILKALLLGGISLILIAIFFAFVFKMKFEIETIGPFQIDLKASLLLITIIVTGFAAFYIVNTLSMIEFKKRLKNQICVKREDLIPFYKLFHGVIFTSILVLLIASVFFTGIFWKNDQFRLTILSSCCVFVISFVCVMLSRSIVESRRIKSSKNNLTEYFSNIYVINDEGVIQPNFKLFINNYMLYYALGCIGLQDNDDEMTVGLYDGHTGSRECGIRHKGIFANIKMDFFIDGKILIKNMNSRSLEEQCNLNENNSIIPIYDNIPLITFNDKMCIEDVEMILNEHVQSVISQYGKRFKNYVIHIEQNRIEIYVDKLYYLFHKKDKNNRYTKESLSYLISMLKEIKNAMNNPINLEKFKQ